MSDDLPPIPDYEPGEELGPIDLPTLLIHYRSQLARLTQQQLADLSGVDQSSISQIEGGWVARPQNATLIRLAGPLSAEMARHGTHLAAGEIVEYLKEARDHKPSPHGLVDGLGGINAMLMPYPRWFRSIAVKAIANLIGSLDQVYRHGRSL